MNRPALAVPLVLTALVIGACDSAPDARSSSDDVASDPTTTAISVTSSTGADPGSTDQSASSTTASSATNPSTTVPRAPTTVPTDSGNVGGVVTGVAPDTIIEDVLAAAERNTSLDRVEMTLLRANAVTWNDGSLGCPEPGTGYTQALVDGYWIQIGLPDNTVLDYRMAAGGRPKLCDTEFADPGEGTDR